MKRRNESLRMRSLTVLALVPGSLPVAVACPLVVGSHMVPQPDGQIPFWGKADPGEKVVVGEFWLGSGPANMEKPLGNRSGQHSFDHVEKEIRNANHPAIRIFQMPRGGRLPADSSANHR